MASVVNNLRVDESEVKKIFFNKTSMKELYFNGILIWKNANPFVFLTDNLTEWKNQIQQKFGSNTIIFEGFNPTNLEGQAQIIYGSYNLVENAEMEKPNLVKGQMVVETTEGEE